MKTFNGHRLRTAKIENQDWYLGADVLKVLSSGANNNQRYYYGRVDPHDIERIDRTRYLTANGARQLAQISPHPISAAFLHWLETGEEQRTITSTEWHAGRFRYENLDAALAAPGTVTKVTTITEVIRA